ncbi:hypothetical protein Poli38472_010960 [Pythium oligandrum]|uniref:Uncharacterized protein n=1 Tax=Pythium oligandrum TaxID=41045 RepID=A0A8K1CEM1_PYTOL|nr:hypothetical protein Poli38472_010960 [Pythium oligandrum]|eukprot:TMW61897.1 hypothetical protein Poli38472_010960 [Pythium oligandrum]
MRLIPKLVCVLLSPTPSAAATTFGCPACTSCSTDTVLASSEDTWSRTTPCSSGYVATLTAADLVVTDSTAVTVTIFDSITQQSYSYESIKCFNLDDIPQINPINNIKVKCNNNAETCDIKINFIMTCKATSTPAPASGIFKDGLQSYYSRTSLSTNCRDPSDCAYRCSTGYGMAVGGSYFYASPSARPDGCSSCYALEGTVGGTNRDTVTGTSPYGFTIKATGTTADTLAVEYTPVQGITCQATYSKAQSAPTNPFKSASYVRSSISTACDVPDACDYKCSLGYTLTAVGADRS